MISSSIDRIEFPPNLPAPGVAARAWRFANVIWLALRVYAGYKSVQLWTRFVSAKNKPALYRRQDLRAARAIYATAIRLEGLLIKASQFIATRADLLPDEWVSTLAGLHDRVPPRPFAMIRDHVETRAGHAARSASSANSIRDADRLCLAGAGASRAAARWPPMRGQGAVSRHRGHRRAPTCAICCSCSRCSRGSSAISIFASSRARR